MPHQPPALVAHEALSSVDPSLHLLGRTGRLTPEALAERITEYAPLGRAIADGEDAADVAADETVSAKLLGRCLK